MHTDAYVLRKRLCSKTSERARFENEVLPADCHFNSALQNEHEVVSGLPLGVDDRGGLVPRLLFILHFHVINDILGEQAAQYRLADNIRPEGVDWSTKKKIYI